MGLTERRMSSCHAKKKVSWLGCLTISGFSGQFFHIFEIKYFCFVVAIFHLMHNVEAIFHLP